MSSPILNHRGVPIVPEVRYCPECGSTEVERIKGFGGYWRDICQGKGCLHVIAEGRGEN